MCGRFTLTASTEALNDVLPLFEGLELSPRYNVAPTQLVTAVRLDPESARPEVVGLRWGLIPSWAKDMRIGSHNINARAETIAEKPTFRAALKRRRCLVLADGFYEWQPVGKKKQPFYFRRPDGRPFAMAGLWERWLGGEHPVDSCTVVTTAANAVVRPVHERMPVILPPAILLAWLDPQTPAAPLLVPCPDDWLVSYPVDVRVNNPRVDDAECVRHVA